MADDLIRDGSDYERVTGEFPIISPSMPEIWERVQPNGIIYVARLPDGAPVPATIARIGGAAVGDVPYNPTDEELRALGFVRCSNPMIMAALTAILHHVPPPERTA